jgi:hypothetical protein
LTKSFLPHCVPGADSASKRIEYLGDNGRRFVGLSNLTLHKQVLWNVEASTFWNPHDLSTSVMGLLYLYIYISISVFKTYVETMQVIIMESI